jgi:hypothetical protein
MFDLQPTATDQTVAEEVPGSIHSGKGKERAADNPTPKRSIYQVLPQNAKDSWLGAAGASKYLLLRGSLFMFWHIADPLPPKAPDVPTEFVTLLRQTLPEVFGEGAPDHNCVYRTLATQFVKEDLQKMSIQRLSGSLTLVGHSLSR